MLLAGVGVGVLACGWGMTLRSLGVSGALCVSLSSLFTAGSSRAPASLRGGVGGRVSGGMYL